MAARQVVSRQLASPLRTQWSPRTSFALSQQVSRRSASGGPSYNEPSGSLFGEKPGRVKEDWENLYMYGMFGGMAFATILLMYKPDTSLQTWALAEAKKKIEAEGGLPKYEKS